MSVLLLACAREAVGDDLVTTYEGLFNDFVHITIPGYKGGTNKLTDFPLLVRVSEGSPEGFSYRRVDKSGKDIRFLYSAGGADSVAVPYEVDTWNTNGVSALWVRLPSVNSNAATRLTMYWAASDPTVLPANVPSSVWSGYSAVWHLNTLADSTANAVNATAGAYAESAVGVVGSALGTRNAGSNGPILQVPPCAAVEALTNGPFTVSAWLRVNLFAGAPWLYSARETTGDDACGVAITQPDSGLQLKLYADAATADASTKRFNAGEWVHVAITQQSAGGRYRVYLNDSEFYYPDNFRTNKIGSAGLAFGGLIGAGAAGTLNGDLDDIRIYPGARTEGWCKNEYLQGTASGYISFGAVSSTGVPVYDEEEEPEPDPGDDPSPGPIGDVSVDDYAGTATFVPEELPTGAVLTNFVMLVKVWEGEPEGFIPSDLPFGSEDIRFFDEQGNVLDFELELWDTDYESFFWVKVPLMSASTRVTMCWGLREGRTLPAVDPTAVWSDYAGVWHMADEHDSTANAAAAAFGDRAVVTLFGMAGKAAGTVVSGQYGSILDIDANEAIDSLTNGPFTVTGWVYLNRTNVNAAALFTRASESDPAWGARFCGGDAGDISQIEVAAGDGSTVTGTVDLAEDAWTRFDVVYSEDLLALYVDGVKKAESAAARSILNGSSGTLSVGGFVAAAAEELGIGTLNGYIDEFRLRPGTISAVERAVDTDQCGDEYYYTRLAATWDETAILQNRWFVYPTLSKTEWREGESAAEVSLGTPWYGTSSVTYLDRSTGETLPGMPTTGGDYRAVFYCAPNGRYSALSHSINFRIRIFRPTHDLGAGNGRILLMNSDRSVADGYVEAQAYNDTMQGLDRPYWEHDVDSGFDYTSTSMRYNFCGGLRHTYWTWDGGIRLWDLVDVRYGNTYNNADLVYEETGTWEEWDDGLWPTMNYLSWNPQGGCMIDDSGLPAEGWHEYAAQAVMCNKLTASINSTLYTNGIGTIYFDAVNSHTDDATNGYYRLVVEMATNALDRTTGLPSGLPTDAAIEASHDEWSETEHCYVTIVHDAYKFADWKPLEMHVRLVNGSTVTDLGTTNELDLALAGGGSYTNFYRVYVPVDYLGTARFRIRRSAINPDYTLSTDVHSMILVDNVICSKPTERIRIEPRGHYDSSKAMRETVGYEGAFIPSYPSVSDADIRPRAKATTLAGTAPEAGTVSSVLMHYRWRYLDQQTTDWMTADLNPLTLVGYDPLAWPGLSGDLEYWYEANQCGEFYQYADYSGLGVGLPDYSEEVLAVTNRAETYATDGKDWFTRIRDGQSTYGQIKLFVRLGDDAPVQSVEMFVARDQIWRGCLQTTNAVSDGLLFRFEGRNRQDDAQEEFQFNTNFWHLSEDAGALPVAGSVVAGTTNDWTRIPCDAATGHLLFQLDEQSLALTVVHADWQDFNGWNDAHRDYFTGTSTADETKSGTSSKQREYLCYASQWDDDCATNALWTETFTPGSYTGYDFYVPFSTERSPNGFDVGEGMWVRGAYADTSAVSGMALQMAGQGRGYVQLGDDTAEKPRGLESVKFSARIAQSVSPDDFALYEGGALLEDYTFLTRAAFDLNGNSNFTGNASISLAAFHRSQTGCYEARWEQLTGNIESGSGTILGPSPRGQRLVLYRWRRAGQAWQATELYAATNSGSTYSWKETLSPKAIPAAFSITNGLMPFAFGAYNDSARNETLLVAALLIPGVADASLNVKGVAADATLPYLNAERGWLYLVYRDKSADRLTRGTYGTLAANCEGVFVRPQIHTTIASWETEAHTKDLGTCVYPAPTNTVTLGAQANFNKLHASECVGDIMGDYWVVPAGRMRSFYETASDNRNGLCAAVVTQTVDVYTAPFGTASGNPKQSSAWTKVGSRTLTGFGTPGVLQDTTLDFWSTDDSLVSVMPGGDLTSVRTDVVVDNILITQWRGDDWLGKTQSERDLGGLTNFVYTSGWVTDGALQLSPKRTQDDYPCSLRVPLCDGLGVGKMKRTLGLGSLSFEYRNAQENARLLVQIVTNGVSQYNLVDYTLDPGLGDLPWVTITNFDFSAMTPAERASGVLTCSPGLHGVTGTMRILVDPTLRDEVRDETNTAHFGSIEIVQVLFRDEPALDKGCWWGFNIRTIGDVSDVEQRMYLPDSPYRRLAYSLDEIGRSLALNNSITDQCDTNETSKVPNPYRSHMPFVQTPTFASNIVGEVSFKARKYTLVRGAQSAEVTLYGTRATDLDKLRDRDWEHLNVFIVSNSTFETYRFKTDTSAGYRAFRLAVTGVDGVEYPGPDPVCGDEPVRVLIDDVLVSEAIRARLAFRNVGAFRTDLDKTTYVANVPSTSEQPIVGEGWGVQAEVYPAMLGEEIDTTHPPRVRLHYYKGVSPWGYANWKDKASSGWMTAATDTNNFYRSSSLDSPSSVIPMANSSEVVQYMLEVVYTVVNSETGGRSIATNWLESTDWKNPSWYHPVDYNVTYGKGATANFAAYSIIDAIAPGWAWINEINIFGALNGTKNTDTARQFVEVVKPVDYDLNNWQLRMLSIQTLSGDQSAIVTNNLATFGRNVSKQKAGTAKCNYMSFIVVGNPTTVLTGTQYDGAWNFSTVDRKGFLANGILSHMWPLAVQLVRPSGIIEHEVAVLGTNVVGAVQVAKAWQYEPENAVRLLKADDASSKAFALPDDNHASTDSVGVWNSQGETALCWNNTMKLTPGELNENQTINPDYPRPGGEYIMVFASVDTAFGHIVQTVGEGTNTTQTQTVSLRSGSEAGLDIYYKVDPWYELGTVAETENKAARTPVVVQTTNRQYKVNVAKGATKNVTVVASAAVDNRLRAYGLDENNRYTPAVLSWLEGGRTLDGKFWDTESCEIALAQFRALSGNVIRDMTLTEMYWLDMDPTASNMTFTAGMVRPPSTVVWKDPTFDPQRDPQAHTNLRMGVYMAISNGNGRVQHNGSSAWAPYVLRGLGSGEISWNYSPSSASAGSWTSETFKVTGYLVNGLTAVTDETAWIPLRYFVFKENSFDANFESEIDVDDPFSTRSPAYAEGWNRWVKEHGGVKPPVYLGWNIDTRLRPVTAEVLAPTNRLDETASP